MKTTANINGDIFIIPNSSFKIDDLMICLSSTRTQMETVYYSNSNLNKNNVSFENTRWVQCWFHDGQDPASNWQDHGLEAFEYEWSLSTGYVPDWVFEDHKEGDVVTLFMPLIKRDFKNEITSYTKVKMSMKLDQSNSRYRNFGKFEEVLKRV